MLTVPGLVASLSALLVPVVIGRLDRRTVPLGLITLTVPANLLFGDRVVRAAVVTTFLLVSGHMTACTFFSPDPSGPSPGSATASSGPSASAAAPGSATRARRLSRSVTSAARLRH